MITDEQHRFGVRQRETFAGNGTEPHVLVMSATPVSYTHLDVYKRQKGTFGSAEKTGSPVWMPEEEPDIGWNPKWMTPRAPEPEGIRDVYKRQVFTLII